MPRALPLSKMSRLYPLLMTWFSFSDCCWWYAAFVSVINILGSWLTKETGQCRQKDEYIYCWLVFFNLWDRLWWFSMCKKLSFKIRDLTSSIVPKNWIHLSLLNLNPSLPHINRIYPLTYIVFLYVEVMIRMIFCLYGLQFWFFWSGTTFFRNWDIWNRLLPPF